ncbi:MAG: ACT domain-containing protein [Bryobacteraceae bacterium]
MGFELWIGDELAWARGTSEYRPLGAAVISASDLFRARDFHPRRKVPFGDSPEYLGLFASVGALNARMRLRRRLTPAARGSSVRSMPDEIRKLDYFQVTVPDKPGEAARILSALEEAGVNLIAFSGFPQGARKAQLDFMAEDTAAFKKAARTAGLTPGPKKAGFLFQGEDHPGAAAAVARKLSEAGINLTSMQIVCAGSGRYGGLFWVKPEDVRKAAKILGAK